jgi:hypothetical protein
MAVITGTGTRNASVVARTPVTICVFSEETFKSFIIAEGFQSELINQWSLRPAITRQPQFANLTSTVIEKLCQIGKALQIPANESITIEESHWYLISEGTAELNGQKLDKNDDMGARPYATLLTGSLSSKDGCKLLAFDAKQLAALHFKIPQLNYSLRKLRVLDSTMDFEWKLGKVNILD